MEYIERKIVEKSMVKKRKSKVEKRDNRKESMVVMILMGLRMSVDEVLNKNYLKEIDERIKREKKLISKFYVKMCIKEKRKKNE